MGIKRNNFTKRIQFGKYSYVKIFITEYLLYYIIIYYESLYVFGLKLNSTNLNRAEIAGKTGMYMVIGVFVYQLDK